MGIKPPTIEKLFADEGVTVSRKGVAKFIKKNSNVQASRFCFNVPGWQ